MKIGIEINGVLRDTIGKFKTTYEKFLIDNNLENSESENPFEYVINEPIDSLDLMNHFSFQSKEEFFSFNVPKVVFDNNYNLIYMSRAAIPSNKQSQFVKAFKQVCIYAFSKKHLLSKNIFNNKSNLEMIEDIEILRFIENSFSVKMAEVSGNSISVDTRKDLKKVINILK